jgi:hypothetical protein
MSTHTLTEHTERPQIRPLGWDRALKLDTAIKAATGAVALAALVLAAVVAWWWPEVFLPSYFAHGIRYWVLVIPLLGLFGTLVEAVSDRLEADQLAAMHPERHIQPSDEGGIGARCVLLAILTTSPVWPQLAHLWTRNSLHGGGAIASSLLLHLVPSLALAVVTFLAVVAVGEYRTYLETTQYVIDCAEINAHAEHRERRGIRTPMAVEVTDLFGRPREK